MSNTGTEVLYLKGTLGNTTNPTTTAVTFSLLVYPFENTVTGTVKIHKNDDVYTGQVTGKTYTTTHNHIVRLLNLKGNIPYTDKLTKTEFSFDASICFSMDWNGSGGFSFQQEHEEKMPVTSSIFRLESINN